MSTSIPNNTKKKVNIIDTLISIIPLLIMLCLNTAATLPGIFVGVYESTKDEAFEFESIYSYLEYPAAQTALTLGFVCYAVTSIIIFYIWYKKAFLKKQAVISNEEIFTPKNIITTIVSALGVSGIIHFYLLGLNAMAPELIQSYSETMNGVGLGSNPLLTIVYACILGPVAEELMFRAVTQSYLHRSGIPAAAAIIIQALLFGIAHMNLVQSSYAFLLGLFIGFLRYKYGNVRIAILAHIAFNIFGTYGLSLIENVPDVGQYAIHGGLAVASIVLLVFLGKAPTRKVGAAAPEQAVVKA